jgi:hypothetical protein
MEWGVESAEHVPWLPPDAVRDACPLRSFREWADDIGERQSSSPDGLREWFFGRNNISHSVYWLSRDDLLLFASL